MLQLPVCPEFPGSPAACVRPTIGPVSLSPRDKGRRQMQPSLLIFPKGGQDSQAKASQNWPQLQSRQWGGRSQPCATSGLVRFPGLRCITALPSMCFWRAPSFPPLGLIFLIWKTKARNDINIEGLCQLGGSNDCSIFWGVSRRPGIEGRTLE